MSTKRPRNTDKATRAAKAAEKAEARRAARAAQPGHDGLMVLAPTEADDPFEPTKRITVMRNIASPIDMLRARHRIDAAQFAAAQRYKKLFDSASIGGARAIDYSRTHVDGGISEPISIKALEAGRELAGIAGANVAGKKGAYVLGLIVGEEMPMHKAVLKLVSGINPLQGQGYVVCRLVEALDALVAHWGLIAVASTSKRAIRVSVENVSGPQNEWEVGKFGDLKPVSRRVTA